MIKERSVFRTAVRGVLLSFAFATLASGCASRTVLVEIPPRMDLTSFKTIGIIEFGSESADGLGETATQRFMSAIHAAQPGVRFLELGPVARSFPKSGRERLDPESVKAIGRQHSVDSVFTGSYEVSELIPQVTLDKDVASARASTRVRMSLTVRLWDTSNGTTIWTNTRRGEWPVTLARVEAGQRVDVRLGDPRAKYAEYMGQIVTGVTSDFRVRYERRPLASK